MENSAEKETCDVCKEEFESGQQLRNHVVMKHGMIENEESLLVVKLDENGTEICFACKICNEDFTSKSIAKNHIETQHKVIDISARTVCTDIVNDLCDKCIRVFHTLVPKVKIK